MHSYMGYCRSQLDCLVLFEAARQGLIPKRAERLSEDERTNIPSGAVYIWDEEETGIKRWTDGKSWSTSRVSGPFLVYRELEHVQATETSNGCRIKPYGLCKQSASITLAPSTKLHLIAYYRKKDVRQARLMQPSMDARFKSIVPLVEAQQTQNRAEVLTVANQNNIGIQPPYLTPMGAQIGGQMGGQIGSQASGQIGNQIGQIGNQLGSQIGNQLGNQIAGQIGGQVGNQVAGHNISVAEYPAQLTPPNQFTPASPPQRHHPYMHSWLGQAASTPPPMVKIEDRRTSYTFVPTHRASDSQAYLAAAAAAVASVEKDIKPSSYPRASASPKWGVTLPSPKTDTYFSISAEDRRQLSLLDKLSFQ